MKKVFTLVLLSFLLLFTSCNKKPDILTTNINATVQGVLSSNGELLDNSSVSLDDNPAMNTMTDQFGKFSIFGVSNGNHILKVNAYTDNGGSIYQEISFRLSYENIDLGIINFPRPPAIVTIDTLTNLKVASVKWKKSTEADFKGYSLYRKNSQDVDNTSGELVFTSSNISDTVFNDNTYISGVTKYYRVYAFTNSGSRTYGSNVEGVSATSKNQVLNGSFESTQNKKRPLNWTYVNQGVTNYDYMLLSTTVVKEGKYSLEVNWTDSIAQYSHQGTLYQRISTSNLVAGRTYSFSFWAKSEIGKLGVYLYLTDKNLADQMNYLEVASRQDWTEKTLSFVMPKDIQSIRIEILSTRDAGPRLHGWIDDIRLAEQK